MYFYSTNSLVFSIITRPNAVVEAEIGKQGSWPTTAPVKP